MRTKSTILASLLLLTAVAGCKKFDGDVTVPAYIHLDSIAVERQAVNAPSPNAGWYTHDIDAVQFIAYFAGESSEQNLGVFQLPCTVPVLHEGDVDYLRIVPVIKQNGIAATRIEYPYFNDTIARHLTLTANDTLCLGTLDTAAQRYYMAVNYKSTSLIGVQVFEPFEALATAIAFDTSLSGVEWIINDPANARTGNGYLLVTTPDSSNGITFPLTDTCIVTDPTSLLYLEMDYHTDIDLNIGIYARQTDGGSFYNENAIRLYPNKEWTKIYINLGRLWAQFNHYPTFRIVFSTLNAEGTGGKTYIDNLKVITY